MRQLRNDIQAAVYQSSGHTILPADLPGAVAAAPVAPAAFDLIGTIEAFLRDGAKDVYGRVMAPVERELLARALRHAHGHQGQASDLLGINRTTLRHKLCELGIVLDRVVADRPDPTDE